MKNQKQKNNGKFIQYTGHNTIVNESYVWYRETSIQPIHHPLTLMKLLKNEII